VGGSLRVTIFDDLDQLRGANEAREIWVTSLSRISGKEKNEKGKGRGKGADVPIMFTAGPTLSKGCKKSRMDIKRLFHYRRRKGRKR